MAPAAAKTRPRDFFAGMRQTSLRSRSRMTPRPAPTQTRQPLPQDDGSRCWPQRLRRAVFLRDRHRTRTGRDCATRIRIALQPLQVGADIGRMLIAQVAILLERFADDVFEFGRKIRDSTGPAAWAPGPESPGRSAPTCRREMAARPSPSHRAPLRTKTNPCAHRGPCPWPALATCRPRSPASSRDW